MYEDSSWLHSQRIACDARVSFQARQCYDNAFAADDVQTGDAGGFIGGETAFCASFSLQNCIDKCADVGCSSAWDSAEEGGSQVNFRGDMRSFVEEGNFLAFFSKFTCQG